MDKRIISLGVLYPKPIDNKIIYVNIHRDRDTREISAEAFSITSFKYKGKNVKKASNCQSHSIHTGYSNYFSYCGFLKRLEKENNAKLNKDRLFDDALDCRSLLENITSDASERLKFK